MPITYEVLAIGEGATTPAIAPSQEKALVVAFVRTLGAPAVPAVLSGLVAWNQDIFTNWAGTAAGWTGLSAEAPNVLIPAVVSITGSNAMWAFVAIYGLDLDGGAIRQAVSPPPSGSSKEASRELRR